MSSQYKGGILPWGKGNQRDTPDQQASNNASRLKLYLQQCGVEVPWVNAVVAFAEYKPLDFAPANAKVEVWNSSNLTVSLERLTASLPSTKSNSSQVVEILQRLPVK